MKHVCSLLLSLCLLLALVPTARAEENAVRIAVIDTGVSTAAIDPARLTEGHNYMDPTASTEDLIGHGTEVTSMIVGSDSAGVQGICPEAVIIPLVYRTLNEEGKERQVWLSDLGTIIRDAVDVYHCDIINYSTRCLVDIPEIRDAVAYAEERGVLFVTCAGNDGSGAPVYPAAYDTALSVGAVNAEGSGAASFSNYHTSLDVIAPGVKLVTASLNGEPRISSGTSLSAPIVSGLAANMLMRNPDLSPAQIRQLIRACADDLGDAGFDKRTGWGLVDVEETLACAVRGWAFRDVSEKHWYFDGVDGMAHAGLMNGTDPVTFSPDVTTTRAMIWTMLYRLNGGVPSLDAPNWYADGQCWAVSEGISDGQGADGTIPREELAVMMYRYAESIGANVTERADLSQFVDAGGISADAVDALAWANAVGLINGIGNHMIDPGGTATRAQVAAIFSRFIENVM